MTAWQRSNITQRSEKGIGPISFKRLLLAGGAGGIVAMIGGRAIGFFPACLSAGLVLAVVLAITHPVEGLALYAFGLRSLRGLAALAAIQKRAGLMALLGKAMQVSPREAVLQADQIYEAVWDDERDGDGLLGAEWEYLGGFGDARGEGLSIVENPFGVKGRKNGGDE